MSNEQTGLLKKIQELKEVLNAPCDIRTTDNVLVCFGIVQSFDGDTLIIVAPDQQESMPSVIYNTEYKIIIRSRHLSAPVWRGRIVGSTKTFWKLDNLSPFYYSESRVYFRQPTTAPVLVSVVPKEPVDEDQPPVPPIPGILKDISLEGIQFSTGEKFSRGDTVLLSNLVLVDGEPPFELLCDVCWADRRAGEQFLYGCRFLSLSVPEQERLCTCIFDLQRKDLHSRRNGRR